MPLLSTILRRTFYTTAALSTILLLATLILWPMSYDRQVYVRHVTSSKTDIVVEGLFGRMFVMLEVGSSLPPRIFSFENHKISPGNADPWSYKTWNTPDPRYEGTPIKEATSLGVVLSRFAILPSGIEQTTLGIPFSYLTLLFSILPLLAFRSLRRRRKSALLNLCPKCHYDLRAHHSGAAGPLCPECGTPVASNSGAGAPTGISHA